MDSKEEIAIDGYDTVSFFYGKPEKGSNDYSCSHDNKTWLFANEDNKQKFLTNPEQYQPQFEGYCGMALTLGQKVTANPACFSIIDNRLYFSKNTVANWLFKHIPGSAVRAQQKWDSMSRETAKDESSMT
jgi:YHS domain-containing protein